MPVIALGLAMLLWATGVGWAQTAQGGSCSLQAVERAIAGLHQMPQLTGCSLTEVAVALQRSEARVAQQTVRDSAAAGTIVAQQPVAGTAFLPGNSMTLSLSNGVAPNNPTKSPGKQPTEQPEKQPGVGAGATTTVQNGVVPPDAPPGAPAVAPVRGASSADLVVSLEPSGQRDVSQGELLRSEIRVTNLGPRAAANIRLSVNLNNYAVQEVSGACMALPCNIATLGAGKSFLVSLTGTASKAGSYRESAVVSSTSPDPNRQNNVATCAGNVSSRFDWGELGFGGALLLVVAGGVGWYFKQPARWFEEGSPAPAPQVVVDNREPGRVGPLHVAVSLRVHLEIADVKAQLPGTLPILRQETLQGRNQNI